MPTTISSTAASPSTLNPSSKLEFGPKFIQVTAFSKPCHSSSAAMCPIVSRNTIKEPARTASIDRHPISAPFRGNRLPTAQITAAEIIGMIGISQAISRGAPVEAAASVPCSTAVARIVTI
jgi:hypothetical protein